ncbi:hypothetical protein V8F63_02740 [Brevundimonas sp. LF-1]|uniref:hypothetical protein n=1 Tax=Brevundimonas sp. LF-1 TaxID=3126100 RepID=UPI0030DFBE05
MVQRPEVVGVVARVVAEAAAVGHGQVRAVLQRQEAAGGVGRRAAAGEVVPGFTAQRTGRIVAIAAQDLVVLTPTGVGGQVAAIIRGVDAHGDGDLAAEAVHHIVVGQSELRRVAAGAALNDAAQVARAVIVVVVLVEAVLRVDLQTLEILAHDEVHDAGDGV